MEKVPQIFNDFCVLGLGQVCQSSLNNFRAEAIPMKTIWMDELYETFLDQFSISNENEIVEILRLIGIPESIDEIEAQRKKRLKEATDRNETISTNNPKTYRSSNSPVFLCSKVPNPAYSHAYKILENYLLKRFTHEQVEEWCVKKFPEIENVDERLQIETKIKEFLQDFNMLY